ncbi:MAG TPA: hypothetical protein PKI93_07540 [Alphaproteobacteria bacterium]|nr:hypothetical protein [Alphaproteobacteria bacterium]
MMIMIDQACRTFYSASNPAHKKEFFYHIFIQKWGSDHENTRGLKEILRFHDWITIPVFGRKLNDIALTIIIHADHDKEFQKEILQKLEKHYRSPDISATDGYAHLHDRTCIAYTPDGILDSRKSRPQRYATQGRIMESGLWQPFETENFKNIEQTRKATGMKLSFLEYFRIINGNNNLTMKDVSPVTWPQHHLPTYQPVMK